MIALSERMPTLTQLSRDGSSLMRRILASRAVKIPVRIFLWLFVVVLAVRTIATVVLERRLAATVETVSGKYGGLMPGNLTLPPVPRDDNQATLFRAAGQALVQDEAAGNLIASVAFARVEAADHAEELHRVFESNRLVFDLAEEASKRHGSSWEIEYKMGDDAKVPDLLEILYLERLIAARARLVLREGSPQEAIAALEPATALAASISREPLFAMQLMGIAVDRINSGVVREILSKSPGLGEEDLSRLRRMLPEASSASTMRLGVLGMMKSGYKLSVDYDEGRLPASLFELGKGLAVEDSPPIRWILRPYTLWETHSLLEAYAAMADELGRPRYERRRFFTNDPTQMPQGRGIFYQLVVPNIAESVLRSDLREASRECARTALALESYARAHREYPDSLDALAPAHLAHVPIDPFSGRPLEYRREGSGYALRSEGDDPKFNVALRDYDKVVVWRIER